MNNQTLFNERLNRILTAADHKEPDRVPILSLIEYYAIGYAKKTFDEATVDTHTELETYSKIHKDIYFDGAIFPCVMHSNKVYNALKSDDYFVSEDGVTLQHKENAPMSFEDYDLLADDYMNYFYNVFFKKKFPALQMSGETVENAVKQSVAETLAWAQKVGLANDYFKNELGMPVVSGSLFVSPLDMIFDFLRGFKPTLMDVRKSPEKVKAACESITEFVIKLTTSTPAAKFPWFVTPLHIESYISRKQVEELYWPYYKKILMAIHSNGGRVWAYLEGEWAKCYDLFLELPDNFLTVGIEGDDIIEAKKRIGHKVALCGGMDLDKLKFGTKQQCIDHAKRVVDECAPGGGFFFTSSKDLISPQDAKPENLMAVNEFVHNYGVYNK